MQFFLSPCFAPSLFLVTHYHLSCHAVLLHVMYTVEAPLMSCSPSCRSSTTWLRRVSSHMPSSLAHRYWKKIPSRSNAASNVLPLWIHPIKPFHTLFIHRKHNRSTHHQPRQPRPHPTPKRQQPFLPPNQPRAPQCTPIQLLSLQTLHPRLDRVERLCHQHRHQSRRGTDAKGRRGGELLARGDIGLGGLAEEVVGAEANGAVGGLAGGGGDEAGEETGDASLGVDDGDGVEEAAHTWDSAFTIVDPKR